MKKKHYLALALSLVFIGGLIVSCAPSKQPDYQADPSPGTGQQTRFTPRTNQRGPGPVPAPSPKPGGMGTQMERRAPRNSPGMGDRIGNDSQQRAEEIANKVSDLREIESATCLITGNTAMVGVQFNQQYKGDLTDQIKKKVDRTVKDQDDRISRVIVTADPDIVARIEDIFKQIGEGRPLSGFTKEINELINRIQPR